MDPASVPVRKLWCNDCGQIRDYAKGSDGNWRCVKCKRMI